MTQRKIPRELFQRVQRTVPDLNHYETVERYVLKTLLEAGQNNVHVDETFIKAADKILQPGARNQNYNSVAEISSG